MPTTIHPFPELRAYAESEARARYEVTVDRFRRRGAVRSIRFHQIRDTARADMIEDEINLLCDLTRDASRDAVCRLVGERIGWCADEVIAACERDWYKMRALWRVVGLPDLPRWEPQPAAPAALALIVTHLWPPE